MISIVIPVYNAEHSINLVDSIIAVFKDMKIEIILINDDSGQFARVFKSF